MTTDPTYLACLREIAEIRKRLNVIERKVYEAATASAKPAEGWAEQMRKKFETVK